MSEKYKNLQKEVKGFANIEYLEDGACVFTFDNDDNCTGVCYVPKPKKEIDRSIRKKIIGFAMLLVIVYLVFYFSGITNVCLFLGSLFVWNIVIIKKILLWQKGG